MKETTKTRSNTKDASVYSQHMTGMIYKIVPDALWRDAVANGSFSGSPVDVEDGFIHFSSASQVRETAAKHFAGVTDLVIVAVSSADLGPELRWEPSRGGDLFPHLYAALPITAVRWVKPLPLDAAGRHVFPASMSGLDSSIDHTDRPPHRASPDT